MAYLRCTSLGLCEVTAMGLRARSLPPSLSWSRLQQLRRVTDSAENAAVKEQRGGLLLSDTCVQVGDFIPLENLPG